MSMSNAAREQALQRMRQLDKSVITDSKGRRHIGYAELGPDGWPTEVHIKPIREDNVTVTEDRQTWTTKDSGERAQFANGGVRDSEKGKPRFDLTTPRNVPFEFQMQTRWAELMGRGAEKYADRNWEQFGDEQALARAKSSAFRHFMQWLLGEEDEDHAAAVFFNVMVVEYVKGVLEGSWPALPAPEDGESDADVELWEGGFADPEPPASVQILEPIEGNTHAPGQRVYRLPNGTWAWSWAGMDHDDFATVHRFLTRGGGFKWSPGPLDKHYRFREVRP